jgi:hypothetical protein
LGLIDRVGLPFVPLVEEGEAEVRRRERENEKRLNN